ncbi:MAG: murein transglycosylase domain-containing protein [Sulfurimonadaceae bacterium]
MRKHVLLAGFIGLLATSLEAGAFEEYKQQQAAGVKKEGKNFVQHKAAEEAAFKKYQEDINRAYSDYKKEVSLYWEEPRMSTKKEWVSYAKDKKTRTAVDFEAETITIETLAKSAKDAVSMLQVSLAKVVTETVAQAEKADALIQNIAKIDAESNAVEPKKPNNDPLLSSTVFAKVPTMEMVKKYVGDKVNKKSVVSSRSKINDVKVYSVTVKLPRNSMQKRSKVYMSEVQKNAKRWDLPMPLIFAIMHTESNFNPMAKSHIPAYGLMQLVPWSGGQDSYNFVYKKKRKPSASYLYDAQNNIELGSAYLHLQYYKYMKKIKNPTSRLYCTIAAYNTGAGNVAYAWLGNYNIYKATDKINMMTPDEVYDHLIAHLKYDEARHYLKKVNKKMDQYHKLYGDI